MTITVITPWWNHRELERDYWAAMRVADVEVLVIDNGSDPPLPNAWRLPFNSGFSHACNVGLELARTDAVLFVNNDVYAEKADWDVVIREGLEPGVLVGIDMRRDPHSAVDGEVLPYLDGWCLGGMREDLLELGGFDEGYQEPAYYSDNDLCLRARAAGMRLRECRAELRHKLNGTARRDDPVTVRATVANRERYVQRARELLAVAA
jgi:GT2 family glycosyltransferase